MKKTVLASMIGAGATIIAAVIGVYVGRDYEQNSVQNQIEEVLGNNVNVIGDGNTVTINDIKSLAENYIKLQSQYENLQDQNNFLLGENLKYNKDLENANAKISELTSETNQEMQQLKDQISQMYNVDFQNISLIVNGIDSGYIDQVANINNETFYSIGFFQYIVDNQAVSSNSSKLFIGNIQSEEQMPVSLFDYKKFTSGYLKKTTNEEDNFGNIYEEAFKVMSSRISDNNLVNYSTEYLLDENFSKFCFDVVYSKNADQSYSYEILILGDGQQLKSIVIDRKTRKQSFEIDVTGVEYLQIVGRCENSFSYNDCYSLIISPYLYP